MHTLRRRLNVEKHVHHFLLGLHWQGEAFQRTLIGRYTCKKTFEKNSVTYVTVGTELEHEACFSPVYGQHGMCVFVEITLIKEDQLLHLTVRNKRKGGIERCRAASTVALLPEGCSLGRRPECERLES